MICGKIGKTLSHWLLAGLLLFPYIGQSIHLHYHTGLGINSLCRQESGDEPADGRCEHNADDCPVCRFHYAAFTQQAETVITYLPSGTDFSVEEPETVPCIRQYADIHLRGPPESKADHDI